MHHLGKESGVLCVRSREDRILYHATGYHAPVRIDKLHSDQSTVVICGRKLQIQLVGGAAWQDTTYHQMNVPINRQNTAAALIYAEASFFKFSKTNFDGTVTLLPAFSDPGRIRINTNVSYYIKIISNLKWNISFYGNWDNQPPPGLSGSDYGTSSGLSWTYGLK